MIESCLLILGDTHLQVNGVAYDVHFRWLQVVEQITIVPILITHGIIIFSQTLRHQCLIIHIPLLHAQQRIQIVSSVHRVAHPRDIAEVILGSFIHFYQDVDVLVIHIPHAVFKNHSITEPVFIVFFDEIALIFLPSFGRILL